MAIYATISHIQCIHFAAGLLNLKLCNPTCGIKKTPSRIPAEQCRQSSIPCKKKFVLSFITLENMQETYATIISPLMPSVHILENTIASFDHC